MTCKKRDHLRRLKMLVYIIIYTCMYARVHVSIFIISYIIIILYYIITIIHRIIIIERILDFLILSLLQVVPFLRAGHIIESFRSPTVY